MKNALICALAFVTAASAGEFVKKGGEYVYRDTLRFDETALDLKTLEIESVNGYVRLSGEERSTVYVEAYVEIKTDDLEEGEQYLKEFKPVVKRSGDKLRVYGEYPETKFTWNDISANMDFVITAPRGLNLNASCANGEIKSVGMLGAAVLESANGEISFESKDGVTGAIDASCANGEIRIDISAIAGDCEFSSANGEISVTVHDKLEGNIDVSTANGEITLALPESSSFRVNASSVVNGSISSDWNGKHESNIVGDDFELVVNEGKYHVECSSANGQINIRNANRAN